MLAAGGLAPRLVNEQCPPPHTECRAAPTTAQPPPPSSAGAAPRAGKGKEGKGVGNAELESKGAGGQAPTRGCSGLAPTFSIHTKLITRRGGMPGPAAVAVAQSAEIRRTRHAVVGGQK